MGVIKHQAIKGSVWSYLGVVIGFVNLVVLSQEFMTTEQIGLTQILVSIATILSQVGTLGMANVAIRLFPHFRNDQNKHNGFIGLSIWIGFAGFLIMFLIAYLGEDKIVASNSAKSSLLISNYFYTFPLIFFMLFFTLFDTYNRMLLNAVLGTFLKEFVLRIANTILIILFIFKIINFDCYVLGYVASQGIPTLVLGIILALKGQLTLKINSSFLNRKLKLEIFDIALFGILSGLSSMVMQNVDRIMVNHFVGLDAVGIYSIAFFFGTLILIPQRAISNISTTVIANSWKLNDIETIKTVYKKSSISQLLIGVLLFVGIWGNIDNVFILLKDEYAAGKWVIFFISLSNLIIVYLGNSYYILITSSKYRVAMWFIVMLILLVILTNFIFIQLWGISGAAFASFLSMALYQLGMSCYVFLKFKIVPDFRNAILIILVGIMAYSIVYFFPAISNFWIDIVVRSLFILLLYCIPLYFLRVSVDVNQKVEDTIIVLANFFGFSFKRWKK